MVLHLERSTPEPRRVLCVRVRVCACVRFFLSRGGATPHALTPLCAHGRLPDPDTIKQTTTTGLPTLRLQLKLLSFEGAPLSGLVALLAIYAGFLPGSSAAAFGGRGSASRLSGGGGGGNGDRDNDGGGGAATGEDSKDKRSAEAEDTGGGDEVRGEGSDGSSGRRAGRSEEEEEQDGAGPAEASLDPGSAGGGKQVEELGLEGLQSRLGMGTPMLHWSLLEALRCKKSNVGVSRCRCSSLGSWVCSDSSGFLLPLCIGW